MTGGAALQPPPLDGTFTTDAAAIAQAADDFGHVVHRRPLAVVRPGSIDDVVRVVRFARERGLKVAARGAGHTTYGQSQVEAGIVIDLRPLDAILDVTHGQAHVEAGASWRSVLQATLAREQMPPVLPDYLPLTVGGTLSVGGIGGSSFRHGALIDTVLALQVVTGAGDLVECSPTRERELFETALGGLGQCAIIVRATLCLVPAPAVWRVFELPYADLPGLTRDLRRLAADGRFSLLEGTIAPAPGGGWTYLLEAVAYRPPSPGASPEAGRDDAALLAGLGFIPGAQQVKDLPVFEYADRVAALEAYLRQAGLWGAAHPWLDLFVPAARVDDFVGQALAALSSAEVGPWPVLLYALRRAALRRPLLRVPDEEELFLFDVLRMAPRDPAAAAAGVAANRALFERNRAHGGTPYVITAVPLSPDDWRHHFGAAWDALAAAKARFDPAGILTPGPGIW